MESKENNILEEMLNKIRETKQINNDIDGELQILINNINNSLNEIILKFREENAK